MGAAPQNCDTPLTEPVARGVTFRQEPNRIFDFMSRTPESMHMLTWLFSPRGIPANHRQQRASA